jgi:hypothetical protein
MRTLRWSVTMIALVAFAGCGAREATGPHVMSPPTTKPESDEVSSERAKLSPEDRSVVEAQEWCVVSNDERLGSMGAPVKLDIKGQTVFVCCASCKRKALAEPDKTLAKVAELKAKKAKGSAP